MKAAIVLWIFVSLSISLQLAGAGEGPGTMPVAESSPPASFQVRNKKFGELLRPEDASNANGTRIVLYPPQPWKCMTWKFYPAGDSVFQLQNHFTSETFSATAAAQAPQPVLQSPFSKQATECPAWRVTKLADGTYKIADTKTSLALTAAKEGDGLRVVTRVWQEEDAQKWELLPIDPKQLTM